MSVHILNCRAVIIQNHIKVLLKNHIRVFPREQSAEKNGKKNVKSNTLLTTAKYKIDHNSKLRDTKIPIRTLRIFYFVDQKNPKK